MKDFPRANASTERRDEAERGESGEERADKRPAVPIQPDADLRLHSLILRQVSDAVISIDNAGMVRYLNPTAERRYDVASADAIGRPLGDLYEYRWLNPQDEADASECLEREGQWRGQNLHVLRDGSVLHVESAVSVLTSDSGERVGLLAVVRDVTATKRAEEALRDREERFRRALSIETVGVLFFTLDGRVSDANGAFERLSGYTREELREIRHWEVLTAPGFMTATRRAWRELVESGETAPYEKQMIRKNGSRWWGLFAPKRIAGSGVAGDCVEFILDITQSKDAEAALQEVEERQRMALDAAELGTWKHDIAAGSVQLDERARAHYGIDAAVTAIDNIVARTHPEDAATLQLAIAEAIDPAVKRPVVAEYRVVHPNGGSRWLSVRGKVRFERGDDGERAVLGIGTTRDISEQKRAEEALREADRRKDEFLAILAHELRNPLAPIRTAVGILRADNVPDRLLLRARDIIERQASHMARLVDDLLDVSRLSRGRLMLKRSRVNLDEVLDVALETARPLIDDRGHRLDDHRASQPIILDADPARLSQVFANLLNNAAKYTPPGGSIALSVRERPGRVDVHVSDTGEGISADHIDTVFELFTQGGGGTTSSAGGLGIGLTLARRLVELHGGSLTVSSPGAGQGATFCVSLPTLVRDRVADQGDPTASRMARVSRRVLVVDDNTDAADTTAMLLQASGCDVRTAYGGEQAVRDVADFRPDIVLLDLGMPGVGGIGACKRMRTLPHGDSVAIVALTGWGQEETRRRTTLAGFDAHLVKPVAPDALLHLVQDCPRRAHAERDDG